MGVKHRCVDNCGCVPPCACGGWCQNGECGVNLGFQGTNAGAGTPGGSPCTDCDEFNVTFDWSDIQPAITAEDWNAARLQYFLDYGVNMAGVDAKPGTKVCQWRPTASALNKCGLAAWQGETMTVYEADDGKYHRHASVIVTDGIINKIAYYQGDTLLGGDGNPQVCANEDPMDPTPTFSDTITWAYSRTEGGGAEPTWQACSPPTSTLFENIPGGAV